MSVKYSNKHIVVNRCKLPFTGYSETIGGMIEKESGISRREWHEVFSGVPRRETLLMAATALAHSYHKALLAKVDDV